VTNVVPLRERTVVAGEGLPERILSLFLHFPGAPGEPLRSAVMPSRSEIRRGASEAEPVEAEPVEVTPSAVRSRPLGRNFLLAMLLIIGVGLGIRGLNIAVWRPLEVPPITQLDTYEKRDPDALALGGDALYYHYQAKGLTKGLGYVDGYRYGAFGLVRPSASHPPAFATYLAMWTLLGVDSPQGHRFAAALLCLVTISAVAGTVRRLARDRAALIAATIAALYPGAWINDTMLLSEALAQAAVAAFLYAATRTWQERSPKWAALGGLAAAVATLTRNEQIVLFAVLVVMLVFSDGIRIWRSAKVWESVRLAAVAGLTGLVLIVPWVARNLATFDQTTIFTTGIGGAISAANCDATYRGELLGWYANCFTGPFPEVRTDENGLPYEVNAAGEVIDETGRDIAPYEQGSAYLRDHTSELPKVVAARVGRLWGWFRPAQTTRLEIFIESRGVWQSWLALASMYALQVGGVVGLVVMRRRRLPISPTLALVAVATFGAAITFGVARYRGTAEIGLMVPAAIAIDAALGSIESRRRARSHRTPPTPSPSLSDSA